MIETTDFAEKEKTVNTILSNTFSKENSENSNNLEFLDTITEENTTSETASPDTLVENIKESIALDEEKLNSENIDFENNDNSNDTKNENSPENLENSSSEPQTIKIEDANTTNCLALTIQKDHKLVAIKNVFFRSIRMSWKVIVSTIALSILKLFS